MSQFLKLLFPHITATYIIHGVIANASPLTRMHNTWIEQT